MAKPRKMLGSAESPYILSLMSAIETQSAATIAKWSTAYARQYILPIYAVFYPDDQRPEQAFDAAEIYLRAEMKLPDAKRIIQAVNESAKQAESFPAAQAAAKAIGQASASIHRSTAALSMAFYGAAAIAYHRVGLDESPETYDSIAAEECAKMQAALIAVSIPNEPKPAKINWYC